MTQIRLEVREEKVMDAAPVAVALVAILLMMLLVISAARR